ncbi:hypothetical protein R1sor_014400 [Riccia sorocarpa]|uniref:BTB domain-containing protein n=1 Tax=Riccia sorocarpa TaxID=122646 RepID=A0ABD3HDJ5_9MARC
MYSPAVVLAGFLSLLKPGILTRVELNLRQLINNVELNDVTFICEDGLRVHGCRVLLAAGSAFFKRLLFGEMVEARDLNVLLPTVPSSVLILVMKFVYTEKLPPEDLDPSVSTDSTSSIQGDHPSPPLDWNFLLKVIGTARFLMLDNLKKVIIDQLRKDVPDGNTMMEEDALFRLREDYLLLVTRLVFGRGNLRTVVSKRLEVPC